MSYAQTPPPLPPRSPTHPTLPPRPPKEAVTMSGHSSYPPGSASSHSPASPQPGVTNHRPEIVHCLDYETTFSSTWYWHASSPKFLICSHCYGKHIAHTLFAASFQRASLGDDGTTRLCRFSQPRMVESLWPYAVASSGSLGQVIQWMRLRSETHTCAGMDGVKGGSGQRWFKVRDADGGSMVPEFLVCGACYEDRILVNAAFAVKFEPVPEGLHKKEDPWACDFAMLYVRKVFEAKAPVGDWQSFLVEAKARLGFPACPGAGTAKGHPRHQSPWFEPTSGPRGLMLCTACYCDQILHNDEEKEHWRQATETATMTRTPRCAMANLNYKICMAQAHEEKNMRIVSDAVQKLFSGIVPRADTQVLPFQEELCKSTGDSSGEWYTLKNDPEEFGICRACYILMAEPLGLGSFFHRKRHVPEGVTLLCCLNMAHPRGAGILMKFLESYVKADTTSFETWSAVWARITPCRRHEELQGMAWYGWPDCTICRECFHECANKYPRIVEAMTFHGQVIPERVMCEMYSPRMRKLLEEVSTSQPLNLTPLLQYSVQRRAVYVQTIPRIRSIIMEQKLNLGNQQMLNAMSTHHMNLGYSNQMMFGNGPYTYGAAGVGYGFANTDFLRGAEYRQQAMGVVRGGQSATMEVGMLEQRWRAVE